MNTISDEAVNALYYDLFMRGPIAMDPRVVIRKHLEAAADAVRAREQSVTEREQAEQPRQPESCTCSEIQAAHGHHFGCPVLSSPQAEAPEALPNGCEAYFAWDPVDGQFETFKTAAEARAQAEKYLDWCRETAPEGWPEETNQICWGEILGEAEVIERRPVTDEDRNRFGIDAGIDDFIDYAVTEPKLVKSISQPSPAQVSDGWKLVPIEPTAEMKEAGGAYKRRCDQKSIQKTVGGYYRAMLAAAPTPPSAEQ